MARVKQKIFIWLPRTDPIYYSIYLAGLEIKKYVKDAQFTQGINTMIGTFSLELANPDRMFSTLVGNETVELYMDSSTGTSTLAFKGYLQKHLPKIDPNLSTISLSGLHIGGKLLDRNVTESYSAAEASTVLKELIAGYAPDFTTVNVADCATLVTFTWVEKPLWDCIKDLIQVTGYDFYVDNTGDCHFYLSGSVENPDEAVVLSNIMAMDYCGEDTADVRNTVRLYGETDEGLPIIYTATDDTSISTHGIKENVQRDPKVRTSAELEAKANALKEEQKNPPTRAQFTTNTMLMTLHPGEVIWASIPTQKVHDQYIVHKYTHQIPRNRTIVWFEERKNVAILFKERQETEQRLDTVGGTAGMDFSWAFHFDDETDISELSGCEISDPAGSLVLASGESSGTMVSTTKNTGSMKTSRCMLKVSGTDLGATTYSVSLNGGVDDKTVDLDEEYNFKGGDTSDPNFINEGWDIIITVNLASDTDNPVPTLKSMVLLYDHT